MTPSAKDYPPSRKDQLRDATAAALITAACNIAVLTALSVLVAVGLRQLAGEFCLGALAVGNVIGLLAGALKLFALRRAWKSYKKFGYLAEIRNIFAKN